MSETGRDSRSSARGPDVSADGSGGALIDVPGVPDFWTRVREASWRCLVLDYDGTLAPFHRDRMSAFPLDGVVPLLERIRDGGGTHLAIMTGRPLSELLTLLGELNIPVSASQGTEFHYPNGTDFRVEPRAEQSERLDRAVREATELGLGGAIERKNSSVALHTRPMEADEAAAAEERLEAVWSVDSAENGLEVRRFLGGIELRVLGIDKGTALLELLGETPPGGLCVYVGDDDTDEDALEVVRKLGIGIKVGSPRRPTHARGRLGSPEDVRAMLTGWVQVTKGR